MSLLLAVVCFLVAAGYFQTAADELRRRARGYALLFVCVGCFFGSLAFALLRLGGLWWR